MLFVDTNFNVLSVLPTFFAFALCASQDAQKIRPTRNCSHCEWHRSNCLKNSQSLRSNFSFFFVAAMILGGRIFDFLQSPFMARSGNKALSFVALFRDNTSDSETLWRTEGPSMRSREPPPLLPTAARRRMRL